MRARGEYAERARELEEVRERNAQKIEQRPELVLEHLTHRQSTFTRNDMAREIFRYIDDQERFLQPDGAAGGFARTGTAGARSQRP